MSDHPDPLRDCPRCGTGSDDRSFVTYAPAPNDAQDRRDWASALPDITTIVCTGCGAVIAMIDPYMTEDVDADAFPRETARTSDRFRVEDELE